MPTIVIVLIAVALVVFLLATSTVMIVQEYERGVIFRLGRLVGARGPSLFFLVPGAERLRKVDVPIVTLEVPAREAITHNNVKVSAVVYLRVVDPEDTVSQSPRAASRGDAHHAVRAIAPSLSGASQLRIADHVPLVPSALAPSSV